MSDETLHDDESAPEEDPLNPKQRVFLEAYLTCWNASQAARAAGYAHPGQQGHRLLKNVQIRVELQRRLEERVMEADEVLARLSEQARGNIGDFIKVSKRGAISLDLAAARDAGVLHLIKSLRRGKHGWIIELHDAQAALVHLGRYYGLFKELNINLDYGNLTDEQLQRIAGGENPLKVVSPNASADPRPG